MSINRVTTKRKIIKRDKYDILDITKGPNNSYFLDELAIVQYFPNFLSKNMQKDLTSELLDSGDVPWKHGIYKMYGKEIPTPRLLYAMRDEDVDITKSYSVTGSVPWTKNMLKLKKMVEKITGKEYTYAQLNHYRDGDDYIGYHTDSEVQDGDVIASISLGAARRFQFRHINYRENTMPDYEMTLEPGSLIIMNEYAAKHHWKHQLPKMPKLREERINITFRPK